MVQQWMEMQKLAQTPKNPSFHKRFPTNFSRIIEYIGVEDDKPSKKTTALQELFGNKEVLYQKQIGNASQDREKVIKMAKLIFNENIILLAELELIRSKIKAENAMGKCSAVLFAAIELSAQARTSLEASVAEMRSISSNDTVG